jgi:YidC/Oxa1 family membrane protein insertase
MLLNWSNVMPEFINQGQGFFGLGPYLNVLPLVTIVLFLWQQKMFMPPPTDEQTAMQQKMMKYMMVFMGFMFFKVASGLCLYFIASSLWGITERKMLPKTLPKGGQPTATEKVKPALEAPPSSNGNAGGKTKKKQRK